jgi:hypothetical protein
MNKDTYTWLKLIVPPLLLLPLVALPPDLPTGILWFGGGIALIVSVLKVVYLVARRLWALAFAKKWNLNLKMLLRPALTIFIMIIAITSLRISNDRARAQALEIAQRVQADCIEKGRCPNEIPGQVGSVGALIRYPISYRVNQDGSEFSMTIRLNIDSSHVISGGVDKALEY